MIPFLKLQKKTQEKFALVPRDSFCETSHSKYKKFYDKPENLFECAINKNGTLPDIQKMNYLKNLVEGKATIIISSIKLTNENYNICLNLL